MYIFSTKKKIYIYIYLFYQKKRESCKDHWDIKTRFILFLDDVWEKVDLGKCSKSVNFYTRNLVFIWFICNSSLSFILYTVKSEIPLPNAHNRSKVVFTTCTEEVCKDMREKTKIKGDKLVARELRICLRGNFEEPATRRLQSGAMSFLLSNSLLISQV